MSRSCWRRTVNTDFEENTQRIFNRKREKLYIPITVFCISSSCDSPRDLLYLDDFPTQLLDLVLIFHFHSLSWRFVMSFVWTSHSDGFSPMISGGIWEPENGEIMMEQSFLGFFWTLTEVESSDFLEGGVCHWGMWGTPLLWDTWQAGGFWGLHRDQQTRDCFLFSEGLCGERENSGFSCLFPLDTDCITCPQINS